MHEYVKQGGVRPAPPAEKSKLMKGLDVFTGKALPSDYNKSPGNASTAATDDVYVQRINYVFFLLFLYTSFKLVFMLMTISYSCIYFIRIPSLITFFGPFFHLLLRRLFRL